MKTTMIITLACMMIVTPGYIVHAANVAPLTLLPQDHADSDPACLDGSPYGFYFHPSKRGSTKWTVNIQGGGWCYDEEDCLMRSKTQLGTSTMWAKNSSVYGCMNYNADGSLDDDCNFIYMPYGDGASFSGYRAETWPVPGSESRLTFRGFRNLEETIRWAFANGNLADATEFVLTGGSAGGLSTFLHADRVAAWIREGAAKIEKIVAAPVVGYFLDHDNYAKTTGIPNTPSFAKANYTTWMRHIYHMQNLTFSNDGMGALTPACFQEYSDSPWLCFMSPHMQNFIETPFFMFNSKYDLWQLQHELQATDWKTDPGVRQAVLDYGDSFLHQFAPVKGEASKNGAFITSCICHGCPWPQLTLKGKSAFQHYADWYLQKSAGNNIHVDPRLPNGNGSLTFPSCAPY